MKQKILLVNDNGHLRALLESASDDGYDVIDASNVDVRDALTADDSTSVVIVDRPQAPTVIGNSMVAKHVREKIAIIAETGAFTLIMGESGTGKETAARSIHSASKRGGRFIKVSCGSMPSSLLERDLFGDGVRAGQLDNARGGTLLLDGVGEMDQLVQSRLMQAMESGMCDDICMIATSTLDLRDINFREDLYYRLSVVTLDMPSLRNRRDDIPLLVDYFISVHARRNHREPIHLTDAAMDKLTRAHWDGNVRQLESVIERATILSSGQTLDAGHFHFENGREEQMSIVEEAFRHGSVRDMEKLMILNRLKENDNNRTQSAKTLDISVRTLRNKLHEYNVPRKNRAVPAEPVPEPVLA